MKKLFLALILPILFSCSDEEIASLPVETAESADTIKQVSVPERINVVENKTNGQVYIFMVDSHEIVVVSNSGLIHLKESCRMCVRNTSKKLKSWDGVVPTYDCDGN